MGNISMNKKDKAWDKYLMQLWGLVIHNRDKVCQWCGKVEGKLDAHHIFGRISRNVRWDKDNGILLCYYCHNWRLRKDSESFRGIAILKVGEKKYLELYRLFLTPAKYIDYQSIEDLLIKELKKLKVTIPKKPKQLM
jgi:hypothetical protein